MEPVSGSIWQNNTISQILLNAKCAMFGGPAIPKEKRRRTKDQRRTTDDETWPLVVGQNDKL